VIELTGVSRVFRLGGEAVHALRDVDLSIGPGDYVAVMGPSGSGKSTLLNLVSLLDRPTAGAYRLDGVETAALDDEALARARREHFGFVFQSFHLIARLSAAQNVELPLTLAGFAAADRRARVDAALEAFGLADRARHRPDELSGGQRQRVAIARATILGPRVVLADEPTGNLDQQSGRTIVEILERLNAGGVTLIVVTHDVELGRRARRQIRMIDGRIVTAPV
jgi:putative ABC transport system ATP-binding protein